MVDWISVVFVTFKVLTFGACMFFAIKWHDDQGKKGTDRQAVLCAGWQGGGCLLLGLGLTAFAAGRMLGLDLRLP